MQDICPPRGHFPFSRKSPSLTYDPAVPDPSLSLTLYRNGNLYFITNGSTQQYKVKKKRTNLSKRNKL